MPTINKSHTIRRLVRRKRDKFEDIQRLYNKATWQNLRTYHLTNHPLCENCEANNKLSLATCVHHKRIISSGLDIDEMTSLAYNPQNIMSLCEKCHHLMHKVAKRNNQKYIDYVKLDD